MNIQPIHTQADYERGLDRIERLMDVRHGSIEEAELEALGALVEAYEKRVYPIPDESEFHIGSVFYTATGAWVVTDVGTRVIVAVEKELLDAWPEGPPYAFVEHTFDISEGGCYASIEEYVENFDVPPPVRCKSMGPRSKYWVTYRQNQAKNKRCLRCGGPLGTATGVRCDECRKRHNEEQKKRT
jgi:hypothetical protein